MLKQTIVWTALPHGIDGAPDPGATVRLSAFVAPRLWNDDGTPLMQLSQFPDFVDWPNVIRSSTFEVQFGAGPNLGATVVSAAPDSALWKALFKTDTDVIPFAFEDLSGAEILTFSAVDVHETHRRHLPGSGDQPRPTTAVRSSRTPTTWSRTPSSTRSASRSARSRPGCRPIPPTDVPVRPPGRRPRSRPAASAACPR